jgi:hypothetical protein
MDDYCPVSLGAAAHQGQVVWTPHTSQPLTSTMRERLKPRLESLMKVSILDVLSLVVSGVEVYQRVMGPP